METMPRKTIELGKVDYYGNGRKSCMVDIEVEITDRNGYPELSIMGGVWNHLHTDYTTCGQITNTITQYFGRNPKVRRILEVWERWHLNGMRAGCEHQEMTRRVLDVKYDVGAVCEDCGYKYGYAWMREDLPAEIIAEVRSW